METVDVLVVGSGQAGVPLAARLAERGRRVVLFEEGPLGGTCVNTGCTPTKALVASAEAAHRARRAGDLGVEVGRVRVDFQAVMDRKDRLVGEWQDGVGKRLDRAGESLRIVRERARFSGPRTLEAGGRSYLARTVILNVGARTVVPPVEGLDQVPWLDHARLLELRTPPRRLVVLGGGTIGCELGQVFRRFGSEVVLVDRASRLLPRHDPEVSEAIEAVFDDEGIALRVGVGVERVARTDGGVRLHLDDGSTEEGDHLLVAVGRRPATDDLGLDEAGVTTDEGGAVVVDDRYRTSTEGVYAVGDCAGGPQFTHASWDDHRILFDLLEGGGRRTRDDRLIPHTIYTDPQVAGVGITEAEARERGLDVLIAELPMSSVARARETGRTAGVIRALVDPGTDRILGAAIVGDQAGELIHVFAVMMQGKVSAQALVDAEMVHPAFAEGLQTAVMKLDPHALD